MEDGNLVQINAPDWSDINTMLRQNVEANTIYQKYPQLSDSEKTTICILASIKRKNLDNNGTYQMKFAIPKPWQIELIKELTEPPNNKIIWYAGPVGHSDKRRTIEHLCMHYVCTIFNKDSCHKIPIEQLGKIVIFDYLEASEDDVNYGNIVSAKNGPLFTKAILKSDGEFKFQDNLVRSFYECPWVICMSNFVPDFNKVSYPLNFWDVRLVEDRGYSISIYLDENPIEHAT